MKILKRFEIMGQTIGCALDEERKCKLVNLTAPNEIEVSEDEANAFILAKKKDIPDFFATAGMVDQKNPPSQVGQIAVELSKKIDREELIAYTDSTTLRNARNTVNSHYARPDGILDLATLTYLCVMYDKVVIDIRMEEVPDALKGIIAPIKLHPQEIIDPRYTIAAQLADYASDKEYLEKINESWSKFLGRDISIQYRYVDSATNSPGRWDYLPGEAAIGYDPVLGLSFPQSDQASERRSLDRDVSIQTWRYLINEKIAETLGCSYNCTSLRYPVEKVALKNKLSFLRQADYLLDEILGEPVRVTEAAIQQRGELPRISLPDPLSVVLQKAKIPEGIWYEIAELRMGFAPVREALKKARRTESNDWAAVEKVVGGTIIGGKASAKMDGSLQMMSGIAGAIPGANAAAAAGLKVAAILKPVGSVSKALTALTRPEIRFLRSFRQQVKGICSSLTDINRLWAEPIDRQWLENAAHLNDYGSLHAGSINFERKL